MNQSSQRFGLFGKRRPLIALVKTYVNNFLKNFKTEVTSFLDNKVDF